MGIDRYNRQMKEDMASSICYTKFHRFEKIKDAKQEKVLLTSVWYKMQ